MPSRLVAVKDAERGQLAEIRQGLQTASYRIAGRRGPPGTVAWDPARIVDPQAALARLLGAGVTVDWQPVAAVPIVEDRPASEAAATEPDRQAETAAGHEPEAAAAEPEPVKPEPRRLAFPYGPPKPCRGPSSKTRRHTASKANACVHCGEHCSPGDLTNIQRPGGGWSHLTCELKAPAAPSPELDIMNPETWTPPPGVIEDDGAPPLFGFRGGSDPRRCTSSPTCSGAATA